MTLRFFFRIFSALLILAGLSSGFQAVTAPIARASESPVELIGAPTGLAPSLLQKLVEHVKKNFDLSENGPYDSIKAQLILNAEGEADHLLVYRFAKLTHRLDFSKVELDANLDVKSVVRDFDLGAEDDAQQPGFKARPSCPDPSTQFVVFAPHWNPIEQNAATEVAEAAEAQGLKTIRLLRAQATGQSYLNYLSCPNLVGNFYDGDANKKAIETSDGYLSANDMATAFKGGLLSKVTTIWVACQAYNDPMGSAMIGVAGAQKFAAGIDNLAVGFSDATGVCAMEAALQGKPMSEAFDECRKEHDITWIDHWGFGGKGADLFSR